MTSPSSSTQHIALRQGMKSRVSPGGWFFGAAGLACASIVLAAVLAPWLAPYDPLALDPLDAYAGSSWAHPLGTDEFGRDIYSRLLYGARLTLSAPAIVVVIAVVAGVALALVASWYGGALDVAVGRCVDVMLSFPGLVLAIAVVAIFGAGYFPPVLALAVSYTPSVARVIRPVIRRERALAYVGALETQGAPTLRIWIAHLLPNVAPLIVVQAAILYGYAMLDLAAISFLGLGVQPPTPEWGAMAADGQASIIAGYPQQSLYAALAVIGTVVAFNALGDRIARRFQIDEFA
ncbi:ABC transporter permease [Microbacterium sp. LWH7-1.2]|uniref:ABC transporter permease n=1 Tax=Microbacterium sp. LWH7-1.2 TaxID=3135257 RepID=UPI00313956B4